MYNDGHAVAREPHVELDAVCAFLKREVEGGQRVFGRAARRAAMADDEKAAVGNIFAALHTFFLRGPRLATPFEAFFEGFFADCFDSSPSDPASFPISFALSAAVASVSALLFVGLLRAAR